ncbi:MAG: SUF system NifU family Fe-S cluster assembly protein [Alphaproteobacteria bacterium 64-11]|nr:SUF system NifU family Fe-S cluster assembly protein [Alphaproteobacteria bacterium]OJU11634.1 MAG: SUF system NifU family Fe-S cluster assembly protein [Alphaproteobacteria bacterium 64-11]
MDNALRELYQEVILDHSRHPRHYGAMAGASHKAEGYNPLCGDRVTVYLNLDADGRVADIAFEGKGCAISQASASMMAALLKGRTKEDAEKLMEGFLHLVRGEDAPGLSDDDRETLEVMGGISEFPMRVKCATLAWHTFRNAVEEGRMATEEGAA